MLATALAAASTLLAGHSVEHRPIKAVRTGPADAARTVLVVGAIHGNERAGRAVVRQVRKLTPPTGVRIFSVASANPDGEHASTRQNARGVDLNRNWPYRWRQSPAHAGRRRHRGGGSGSAFDTYFPGPRAASEPETRAMRRLIRRVHPDVTLWYHQHLSLVTLSPGADHSIVRAYGKRVGLPAERLPRYHGTATSWQNHRFPRSTAFVVELPAGSLTKAAARRHARAALATVAAKASAAACAPKPKIVKSKIPFPRRRMLEMRRYSRRHYRDPSYKLREVRTIVEHYTANTSYSATFNTFAADTPDPELGELPGTCAHFVIDTDGTIHQLVSLRLRCRHTVGLNDRSIGIEHVATSDAGVLGNKRMLRASLKLTRWLQSRYDVPTKHVIGHSESLGSPFHHERVARLRTQTHGDMTQAAMKRYRRKLSR